MHARALCIGQYIAAADFGVKGIIDAKEPTFTIGQARHEQVADMKKPDKELTKGILYFQDYPRGWVINKTNMQLLIGLFGDDTDRWVGKRVTLAAQLVSVGRGKELGIRVHGSPELTEEREVIVKLPKKSPQTFKLVPTGRANGVGAGRGNDDPAILDRLTKIRTFAESEGLPPEPVVRFFGKTARDVSVPVEALIADISKDGPERVNLEQWIADNA